MEGHVLYQKRSFIETRILKRDIDIIFLNHHQVLVKTPRFIGDNLVYVFWIIKNKQKRIITKILDLKASQRTL